MLDTPGDGTAIHDYYYEGWNLVTRTNAKYYETFSDQVVANFGNGVTTTLTGAAGGEIVYRAVTNTIPTSDGDINEAIGWLTDSLADTKGQGRNGYYVFTNTFSLSNADDLPILQSLPSGSVSLEFSGLLGTDDHLEAIFLNGQLLADFNTVYNTQNWEASGVLTFEPNVTFEELNLSATGNTISFITHNNGQHGPGQNPNAFGWGSSYYGEGENAFGFGGNIWLFAEGEGENPFNNPPSTPEPATMLILGLGLAGLGLARRRK
ncbi:hypothetical protein FACS189419_09810 [Planctomycetales bacterium]|nr:hypothetical protein FACS189419_09810 [Planctomycetales bacterium]